MGEKFVMLENENIRLIQGDCLEAMRDLVEQGIKVDAIITDPPYGIDYQTLELKERN